MTTSTIASDSVKTTTGDHKRYVSQMTLRQRLDRSMVPATVSEALQSDPLRLHAVRMWTCVILLRSEYSQTCAVPDVCHPFHGRSYRHQLEHTGRYVWQGTKDVTAEARLPAASDASKRKRADAPAPIRTQGGTAAEHGQHSFEEARWRHHQTQPPAQSLPRASQPQAAAEHNAASSIFPAQAAHMQSTAGERTLPEENCSAQLETITEVTDEVCNSSMPSVQRGRLPAGAVVASRLGPSPPHADASSQPVAPVQRPLNSGTEHAAERQCLGAVHTSSGVLQQADEPMPQLQQQSVLAAPTPDLSQSVPPAHAGHNMQPTPVVEDDVTFATAAAFAEMNDMFSSALQHGTPAPPAVSAPPAERSTDLCLAATLPVLGDEENANRQGLKRRPSLAPGVSPSRRLQPAHSAPAPSHGSSVVAGNAVISLGGGAAVIHATVPEANSPAGAFAITDTGPMPFMEAGSPLEGYSGEHCGGEYREPTVTLATREAFAALNGMFAAQLPHSRAARPAIPLAPRPSAGQSLLGSSSVARGATGRSPCEDTRAVPIYEDTQFLLAPANSPAAGSRTPPAAEATQPLFLDAAPAVAVGEDTQLLTHVPGLDRTATLAVYEDTALLPRGGGTQSSSAQRAAGSVDATVPVQLYEDTQFLTRALPRCSDGRVVTPFAAAGADPVRTPATEVQQVSAARRHDEVGDITGSVLLGDASLAVSRSAMRHIPCQHPLAIWCVS